MWILGVRSLLPRRGRMASWVGTGSSSSKADLGGELGSSSVLCLLVSFSASRRISKNVKEKENGLNLETAANPVG